MSFYFYFIPSSFVAQEWQNAVQPLQVVLG